MCYSIIISYIAELRIYMGMMIVNDDEFEQDVKNTSISIVKDIPTPGRNKGDVNVPESLRNIISETAIVDGRKEALALAELMNISASSVSAYTKSATSTDTYNKPDEKLKNHNKTVKDKLMRKSRSVMRRALTNITDEKLADSRAIELASIAKSMSSIVTELDDDRINDQTGIGPSIVIFAPQVRSESNFEFININE